MSASTQSTTSRGAPKMGQTRAPRTARKCKDEVVVDRRVGVHSRIGPTTNDLTGGVLLLTYGASRRAAASGTGHNEQEAIKVASKFFEVRSPMNRSCHRRPVGTSRGCGASRRTSCRARHWGLLLLLSRQKRGKRLSGYDWPKKEKLMVDKSTFHNGMQTLSPNCRDFMPLGQLAVMPNLKRGLSPAASPSAKRARTSPAFRPKKIATVDAAAAVNSDTPLSKLLKAVEDVGKKIESDGISVTDNRALSLASAHAKKADVPLVVVFILSPQCYKAHDRAPRRIDFTLRKLVLIKASLQKLHIPLRTITEPNRRVIPHQIISFLEHLNASAIYTNIEYEVGELQRDIEISKAAREKDIDAIFTYDKCVVEPGVVLTKEKRAYSVRASKGN
ncbi:DNA photolyase [Mycena olivaceomarginata]|nr:DNA photolyase [Mycena olivaceomarginata]